MVAETVTFHRILSPLKHQQGLERRGKLTQRDDDMLKILRRNIL